MENLCSDPDKDRNSELEVNISALALDASNPPVTKMLVKEELLGRINECKLTRFEQHLRGAVLPIAVTGAVPGQAQLDLSPVGR